MVGHQEEEQLSAVASLAFQGSLGAAWPSSEEVPCPGASEELYLVSCLQVKKGFCLCVTNNTLQQSNVKMCFLNLIYSKAQL